jgi:predicted aspartyl protease
MTTQEAVTYLEGPPRIVGQVFAHLRIANFADLVLASRGIIPEDDVRSIELEEVLVDTGATHMCLPAEIIAQLGLELAEEIRLETAMGATRGRLMRGARLEIVGVPGRDTAIECIETPAGTNPLMGCLPMEQLTVEPDVINHKLRILPRTGRDTRMFAY